MSDFIDYPVIAVATDATITVKYMIIKAMSITVTTIQAILIPRETLPYDLAVSMSPSSAALDDKTENTMAIIPGKGGK